jgi:hypothetical protein
MMPRGSRLPHSETLQKFTAFSEVNQLEQAELVIKCFLFMAVPMSLVFYLVVA